MRYAIGDTLEVSAAMTAPISVRLDDDVRATLEAEAKARGGDDDLRAGVELEPVGRERVEARMQLGEEVQPRHPVGDHRMPDAVDDDLERVDPGVRGVTGAGDKQGRPAPDADLPGQRRIERGQRHLSGTHRRLPGPQPGRHAGAAAEIALAGRY